MNRPAPPRTPRIALVAVALAVVTMAAHTAGGGALDPISAGVVAALSGALAAGIAHRRIGMMRLAAAVLGAQAVLHLVMTVSAAHGSMHGHVSDGAMLAGHVAAAIITAAVVIRADALVVRWRRLIGTALGMALPATVPPIPAVARPSSTTPPTGSPLRVLLHRVQRRGPPMAWLPQTI